MSKRDDLQALNKQMETLAGSLPLATAAGDIVPGEGNPDAEIMFIGEAPGYHESVQRRPFVGRSGQLFRKTLVEEAGIAEKDVYISNIVKVRPPDNRDPLPEEILAFKPFLDTEIQIIKPLVIATLGRFSMGKFLPDVKVSQVHGRLHKIMWEGQRVFIFPLYHPAAALRGNKIKDLFVSDVKKLPKVIAWIKEHQAEHELEDSVKNSLL